MLAFGLATPGNIMYKYITQNWQKILIEFEIVYWI